jgi:hypothetical protein
LHHSLFLCPDCAYERRYTIVVLVWLTSLNMIIFTSIHFPASDVISLIFTAKLYIYIYIYIYIYMTFSLSIHQLLDT